MDPDRMFRNMMQGIDPFSQGMSTDPFSSLMPHGFMNPMSMMMVNPFQSMQQAMSNMTNNGPGNNFSYCTSSVTYTSTDEHGRPQVYQQSDEFKSGPDGLRETKHAVRDSRTGHQELAIGHHLHEKSYVKKKSKNVYTGDEEQAEDLVNIEENEAEAFERDWMNRARNATVSNQLGYGGHHGRSSRNNRLAITGGEGETSQPTSHRRSLLSSIDKALRKEKKKKKVKEDRNK